MGKKNIYFQRLSEKEIGRQQAIANIKLNRMIAEAVEQAKKDKIEIKEPTPQEN